MWNPESTGMESGIHSVESGIQDSLGLPYMGRDMHGILTTNINKRRGEKKTRRKKCQIFASAMYSSYHAGVSPEDGLEVGQTL